MSTPKQAKAIATVEKILSRKVEIVEAFKAEMKKIDEDMGKLSVFLMSTSEVSDVPEIVKEMEPFLAWSIMEKNDATSIEAYRNLRDKVQSMNREAKDYETLHNDQKDKIGTWLLEALNKSGANSVNCGVSGKAYKKRAVKASPADWDAFLHWVDEEKAYDAVQKRVNSSFVDKFFEEKLKEDEAKAKIEGREPHGEYPPFLNVSVEWEVVVTK